MQNEMHFKRYLKGKELKEKLRRIESHGVGIRQEWLPQLNVRIPQRPFPTGVGLCDQFFQRVVKEGDIPEIERLIRKESVPKQKQIQEHQ